MDCRNEDYKGSGNPNFNNHKLAGIKRPQISRLFKKKYKKGELPALKKINQKLKEDPKSNPRYGKRFTPKSEIRLISFLNKNNIDFVHQKSIKYSSGRGCHFIVDFFLPKQNLVIEIDDYPKASKYEKEREAFIKSKYNLIRVDWRYTTEEEIKCLL